MEKFDEFLKRTGYVSKPFQRECLEWSMAREKTPATLPKTIKGDPAEKRGGILALEMGLGKTIIMLALIECHLKRHTLIVLPRSLIDQWEKIIKEKFGHHPLVYHGSRPKSMRLTLAEINARPIIITTYGQVSMPSEKQAKRGRTKSILHDVKWNRVICDEAHNASHEKTNGYKGVKELQTEIMWLVTGTPIQNTPIELYNLYYLFCSSEFKFEDYYFYLPEIYKKNAQHLVFFRTKSDVSLPIPELHKHSIEVEWENNSERNFAQHIHSLAPKCNISTEAAADYLMALSVDTPNAMRMKYFMRARQSCVNPSKLKSTIKEYQELLTLVGEKEKLDLAELKESQSKINAVVKTLIERRGNGCGKIVFCHFYHEIDTLEKCLREKARATASDGQHQHYQPLRIAKFDGRVPTGKRDKLLNEPVDILLAQIKMCREGLNLQKNYSEAYFPIPHFNPAVEQQAIARCWRIGQEKPVNTFHYTMSGTMTIRNAEDEAEAEAEAEFYAPCYSLDTYSIYLHIKKLGFVNQLKVAARSSLDEDEDDDDEDEDDDDSVYGFQ